MHNANLNQGLGTNYTAQAGIGGFAETSQNFPGFPQLSITGYQGIAGNAFQPLVNPTNMYRDRGQPLLDQGNAYDQDSAPTFGTTA